MINPEDMTTTVFYYDKKTCNKQYISNFSFLSTFRYKSNDFYVLKTLCAYKVCIQASDTDLLSVWSTDLDHSEYEVKETFKKKLDEYSLTKNDINEFINDPKKYKKNHKK